MGRSQWEQDGKLENVNDVCSEVSRFGQLIKDCTLNGLRAIVLKRCFNTVLSVLSMSVKKSRAFIIDEGTCTVVGTCRRSQYLVG
jgi:hypothetical protein